MTVPAFRYETKVYEGMNDAIHGGGRIIEEIFIPSLKIIFNSEGYLYPAKKPKNEQLDFLTNTQVVRPLKEINLSLELVEKIDLVAKKKLEVSKLEEEMKADLKKVWG